MLSAAGCSGEPCAVLRRALGNGATPAGNTAMLALFAALIPPAIYVGLRYRARPHASLLLLALLVDVVGHVAKVLLVGDPNSHAYSTVYLLGTHWGAVLVGSSLTLVLPHVMVIYGDEFRLVSNPVYLNILLFIVDIFSLAFQSVGIGFASTASTDTEASQGVNILLTGLAIQAVGLLVFLGTYRYFRYRLSHRRYILDDRYAHVYLSRRFRYFLICVQIAASLLLARTAVRIGVFASGLNSGFARSQITSLLLDDTLVFLAALILIVYPAGRAFGGAWAETSPIADHPSPSGHQPRTNPLPLRRHRRNQSSRINNYVISLPYQSPSTSPRFSPGSTTRGGMPSGLPAHPSPQAMLYTPPLMSPRSNPVHHRVPYAASPTQDVPFLESQESPGLDPALWMTPGPSVEHGKRKKMWAGSGKDDNQMVESDALWN